MNNNKGVTLVELLIVIVVMGIIAAFAVPSVQTIISNTRKSAVYADALAIEQASDLYCADVECATNESLNWTDIEDYVEGIDTTNYYDVSGDPVVALLSSGSWQITLEAQGTGTGADSDPWEFVAAGSPSETDRDTSVLRDAN